MYVPSEKGVILCFVAGTQVHTDDGVKRIEDLEAGDLVTTHNAVSHRMGSAHISTHFSSWTTHLIHVPLPGETITCTAEHPFWVVDRGWTKAAHLTSGDRLQTLTGDGVPILEVTHEKPSKRVRVYNMTVDAPHTYFVGKAGVLVHNKKR